VFRKALGAGAAPIDRRILAGLVAWDRLGIQLRQVEPALARGDTVLCERYILDLCVFGTYRGTQGDWLSGWLAPLWWPDLAFVVDAPADEVLRRLTDRGSSGKLEETPQALRDLLALYRAAAERYGAVRLDSTAGFDATREAAWTAIKGRLNTAQQGPTLAVLIGSVSDKGCLEESGLLDMLAEFGLAPELAIISSDRNPEQLRDFCLQRRATLRLVIAAAGGVPNLPVVVKSWLPQIPVVGVPLDDNPALALASLTTPGDRPVLVVGWGVAGLRKAAYVARDLIACTKADR
jgi:phosphoribosylcarboxyaminoimidazole (NCAIR) mutase/thymidylate kinase